MGEFAQRSAQAQRLRSDGLLYREVAERMGIDIADAHRLANPEACEECGEPRGRHARVCENCYQEGQLTRLRTIASCWREGASLKEIAERLGSTVNSIGATMVRMRKQGWDLPYRQVPRKAA
jgi:transposase